MAVGRDRGSPILVRRDRVRHWMRRGTRRCMETAFKAMAVSRLCLLLGILLAGFAHGPTYALDPTRDLNQYKHTRWTITEGAPQGIYGLVQGPDGYLWIGGSMLQPRRQLPEPPQIRSGEHPDQPESDQQLGRRHRSGARRTGTHGVPDAAGSAPGALSHHVARHVAGATPLGSSPMHVPASGQCRVPPGSGRP
jgi:hypothetical protein